MKLIISNDFHNFRVAINGRNGYPSDSSIKKALRAAKPFDCKSVTTIRDEDGNRYYYGYLGLVKAF
jgi:hypothetical protein